MKEKEKSDNADGRHSLPRCWRAHSFLVHGCVHSINGRGRAVPNGGFCA